MKSRLNYLFAFIVPLLVGIVAFHFHIGMQGIPHSSEWVLWKWSFAIIDGHLFILYLPAMIIVEKLAPVRLKRQCQISVALLLGVLIPTAVITRELGLDAFTQPNFDVTIKTYFYFTLFSLAFGLCWIWARTVRSSQMPLS